MGLDAEIKLLRRRLEFLRDEIARGKHDISDRRAEIAAFIDEVSRTNLRLRELEKGIIRLRNGELKVK